MAQPRISISVSIAGRRFDISPDAAQYLADVIDLGDPAVWCEGEQDEQEVAEAADRVKAEFAAAAKGA